MTLVVTDNPIYDTLLESVLEATKRINAADRQQTDVPGIVTRALKRADQELWQLVERIEEGTI